MHFMNNLNMRWKLLITFGTVLLLLASQQVIYKKTTDNIATHEVESDLVAERVSALNAKDNAAIRVVMAANRAILTGAEEDIAAYERTKSAALTLFQTALPTVNDIPDYARELSSIGENIEQWCKEVVTPTLSMRKLVGSGKHTLQEVSQKFESLSKGGHVEERSRELAELVKSEEERLEKLAKEGEQDRAQLAQLNVMLFSISAVIGITLAILISINLASRIDKVQHALEGMAKGDFEHNLDVDGSDELGRTQVAINEVNRSIGEKVNSLKQALKVASSGDFTRDFEVTDSDPISQTGDSLNQLLASLRASLGAVLEETEKLAVSSQQVRSVSQNIQSAADQTSRQSNAAASGSEEVSRNVQTVAAAAEEMSVSIREIAKNAADAARVATEAVRAAGIATETISRLGESSVQIGNVVKVITTIAQQTNLLALNATIEAARAGEAGKGFAVVANEVKSLAQETAKATEDISRRVETIQSDTKAAVSAIAEISQVIHQVNDISSTIASAVEEQTATTNEISRSVGEAARGSSEITHNILSVVEASRSTSDGIREVVGSAERFTDMAKQLEEVVSQFHLGNKPQPNRRVVRKQGERSSSQTGWNGIH